MTKRLVIEATGEVQVVQVSGDWAYGWSQLVVTVKLLEKGASIQRGDRTLTILRREPDGRWMVFRSL